jgi:tryptophan synthase alpha chain
VLVGFGVSTPEQVKLLSGVADGAIVGSALVRRVGELAAEGPEGVAKGVESYIADLVKAAM